MPDPDPETPEDVDAPDVLPTYIEDMVRNHENDAEVLAAISTFADRLESVAALTPETIEAEVDGSVKEIDRDAEPGVLVQKLQRCGDESCKCASGRDDDMHGPYWWRVTRNRDGSQNWEYIGKEVESEG